jgi:hypothetical protein
VQTADGSTVKLGEKVCLIMGRLSHQQAAVSVFRAVLDVANVACIYALQIQIAA